MSPFYIKPRRFIRLEILDETVSRKDNEYFYLRKKFREGREVEGCPYCETEKIVSRFDILDIR